MHTQAPAKLNLCLRIVGRRDDGRHLLESLFWPIDLCDELTLEPGERSTVTIAWADDAARPSPLPTDGSNLVMRALTAAGRTAGVRLLKRIPAEAGLGGGSSDAAAVLRLLGPSDRNPALALALGADVPFFLDPRPGWMTGIGEARAPWTADGIEPAFVVAVPPFPLSTAAVFSHFRENGRLAVPGATPPSGDALWGFLRRHGNALETSARALEPRLGAVLAALAGSEPLHSGMSGSGSACFAIFETLAIAKKKAQVLAEEFRSLNCRWIAVETHRRRAAWKSPR